MSHLDAYDRQARAREAAARELAEDMAARRKAAIEALRSGRGRLPHVVLRCVDPANPAAFRAFRARCPVEGCGAELHCSLRAVPPGQCSNGHRVRTELEPLTFAGAPTDLPRAEAVTGGPPAPARPRPTTVQRINLGGGE